MTATARDNESIVGDECHIVARSSDGPRGNPVIPEEELNDYPNLILLCKTHHKLVDDQANTYTVEKLKVIKHRHEKWVRETLQHATGVKRNHGIFLSRILTGKEALSIVIGAEAYEFDYDEPNDIDELELICSFLQTLQDWGEFGEDLEISARAKAGFDLTREIEELDESGFAVFGASQTQAFKAGDGSLNLSVATIRVVRKENSNILKFAEKDVNDLGSII